MGTTARPCGRIELVGSAAERLPGADQAIYPWALAGKQAGRPGKSQPGQAIQPQQNEILVVAQISALMPKERRKILGVLLILLCQISSAAN
jgi:hypothetical protein